MEYHDKNIVKGIGDEIVVVYLLFIAPEPKTQVHMLSMV